MCAQADWLTESNKLRLKYVLKSERLRTFDKWPFSDESNCSAEKVLSLIAVCTVIKII